MFGPLSRGVRMTILAAIVLLALPQTSDAQYFFGRGGAYFGGGFNTPYYGGGFFGPAYGGYGWGGYGGARSFAYANSYSNSNTYSAAPTVINNNIYVTPTATNQQPVDPPAMPTPGNKAAIDVVLPADAELWFDGASTKLTGSVRSFVTPPLTAGTYSYEVRATWKDQSGSAVTRTRLVQVTPNQHVVVNLTDVAQETKKNQ